MEPFQWQNAARGRRIESFVHSMTCRDPMLMREVLMIGMGNLREWTDTGVLAHARCGCLIGTCAIAAVRLARTAPVCALDGDDYIVPVATTLAAAVARGNRRVAERFERVGREVAGECDGAYGGWYARERAVRAYLRDLIATDLRLLKLTVLRQQAAA